MCTSLLDRFVHWLLFCFVGPLTVFIPSNQAFEEIPAYVKDFFQDLSYVKTILLYHIIHGLHPKNSIENEAIFKSEYKMEDTFLDVRLNIYHEGEVYLN